MAVYECLMPYCRAEVYDRRDVCQDCWDARRPELVALPELYVMVWAMLTPGSRIQDINQIQVSRPGPRVPFNMVAFDALEYAYARLAAWAEWVHTRTCGVSLRLGRYTSGRGFAEVVDELRQRDSRLASTSLAGEYVTDVHIAYRRMLVQCQPTEPRHLDVACPECGHATVVTRHADEFAACLTCAYVWPHSRLSALCRQPTGTTT